MKRERPSRRSNSDDSPEVTPLSRPFIADDAPKGTVVQIGKQTPDERLAGYEFHRYMFQYFESVASGQTGWGVDFNGWLHMARGWKHLGLRKFIKIYTIAEIVDDTEMVEDAST